jgi:AcrR family transcriptional regulator
MNSAPTTGAAPAGATDPVPNRRERKKLQTRDALEAAAMKLFAARGYDATTVEEIAVEADVAVRTFFRYFGSKQDVLLGDVAHDVAGRLTAALESRPADQPPIDAVGAALDALELEIEDQPRQVLHRIRLVERVPELRGAYHLLFQELHDVIAEFVAARTGDASQQLDPQLIASAAVGAIKTALTVFQNHPDGEPVGTLRLRAYATLTAGMRGRRVA